MKQVILLLALCSLPLASLAEKGQSIMFGDPDPVYTESDTKDPAQEKADYCNELRKQMDELKGKPQQRNAVVQRYQLECQQR
jgi:Skp family chaperone for outer membrane proteins